MQEEWRRVLAGRRQNRELILPRSFLIQNVRDSSMYSWHCELCKVFDWNPLSFPAIPLSLAIVGVESKSEVSEGLLESADGPLHFSLHSHLLFYIVPQTHPYPGPSFFLSSPIWELP